MTELRGEKIVLRPPSEDDVPALRAIASTSEVVAWWGRPKEDFPMRDDPEATRFAVLVRGEVAGLIQFSEESEPEYRHAWIDIFLEPAHHLRGLGTEAIEVLLRHLIEDRGHHRVTIDPAADNAVAIRCYEKVGFRPVGVMRAAWHDSDGAWRDVLLMELVVPPG